VTARQQFDNLLSDLANKLFDLGQLVERQIDGAVSSLGQQDLEAANQILAGDKQVNRLQAEIEDSCMLLIATQQPLARDLRKIVAAFKISIYLERMGDLAVDVAKVTLRIGAAKLIKPLIDIPRMSELVRQMVSTGIKAYVEEDATAATSMSAVDDQVDHLYSQIFRELLVIMLEDPKTISQANYLLFAARFLERMGDYCTNIAEETVYVVTGRRSELN